MKQLIFTLIVVLGSANTSVALPRTNYRSIRNQILEYEQQLMLGASLTLNDAERAANDVLMKAKNEELKVAFENPTLFPPSKNFLSAKSDIDRSEVFKLLRRMPKGAVLHAHDTAMVTTDYMYRNITFRENLYVCDDDGVLRLQFFDKPNEKCNWELLHEVRQHPARAADVNKRIMTRLSMACNKPDDVYTDVNKAWTKFTDIFEFVTPFLTYRPVYEAHFLRALEELYEDNVMYLELRTTLPKLYDFDGVSYTPEDLVGIYQTLSQRFMKEHPDFLGVKMIYAPRRSGDHKQAEEYMKTLKELQRLYPNFVAGFDLVGQEDNGHTLEYFADVIMKADPDTKFFFHAGETKWFGTSTDENLVDAILLNTRRIGHGYALQNHPFLLELVRRMDIAIEVNPISNQVLKLTDDLRNHPARRLFAEGYPVVISNDDPSFWGSRALSYDFYEALMALMSEHADLRALKQLAMNSLAYSSMSDPEKQRAFALWEEKWNTFVTSVAKNGH